MTSLLSTPVSFVSIQNIRIRYCMAGEGEPLVLIHGLGACLEYWYKNIPFLSKHYRVIAFDLPGFGLSDKPQVNYGPTFYVDFMKTFLKHFGLSKTYVVGHSLGGGIALQLALEQPQSIKKLCLLCPIGFSTQLSIAFRLLTIPLLRYFLMRLSKTQFAKAIRAHVFNPASLQDAFIDTLYPYASDPQTQKTFLYILAQNANLFGIKPQALAPITKHLTKISSLPIKMLWGKEDPVLPYFSNKCKVDECLPHATFISVDQCGHLIPLEHPDVVNKHILVG